jgi:hypothetical protein
MARRKLDVGEMESDEEREANCVEEFGSKLGGRIWADIYQSECAGSERFNAADYW